MDYTQNAKIAQVTEKTLIIGVDVGSETHYARAFNWRGQEFSKKAFSFGNDLGGYLAFAKWLDGYRQSMNAEKVFFVGVGRVMLALECIAKRYAHLGIHAVVVGEITEPAITPKDVLVVGSGSGETLFPLGIARKAHSIGAKVVHIGSNPKSSMTAKTATAIPASA